MYNLKKVFAIVVISILPTLSYAQKCSLDVDETDAFTKEHVKSGTNAVGGVLWHWKLTLRQSGTKYGWEMQIKYGKHFQDDFKKGDIVYCKLAGDKVVKLIADNNYSPTHTLASDGFMTSTYLPKGEMTQEDMKAFAESPLSEMRVTLSGIALEPNISSKQGNALQNIAQCILKP